MMIPAALGRHKWLMPGTMLRLPTIGRLWEGFAVLAHKESWGAAGGRWRRSEWAWGGHPRGAVPSAPVTSRRTAGQHQVFQQRDATETAKRQQHGPDEGLLRERAERAVAQIFDALR
jgi:hypothetical protein